MWLASAIEPNGSQRADVDSSHWYRPLAPWIQKENRVSHPARCSAFCGKEVLSWCGRPPRGGGTLNDKQTKAVWGKRGARPTLPGFLERLPSPSSQTRPEMAVLRAVGEAAWGSWWLILAQRMKMVFLILYYQPATYPHCASLWALKMVLVPAFFVERTRSQYSTKRVSIWWLALACAWRCQNPGRARWREAKRITEQNAHGEPSACSAAPGAA